MSKKSCLCFNIVSLRSHFAMCRRAWQSWTINFKFWQDLAALFVKKDFSSLRRLDLSTGGEDTVNDQLLQVNLYSLISTKNQNPSLKTSYDFMMTRSMHFAFLHFVLRDLIHIYIICIVWRFYGNVIVILIFWQ